jgi:hypothetical protein
MPIQISATASMTKRVLIPNDSGSLGDYRFEGEELYVSLAEEKEGVASQWFYFQVIGVEPSESLKIRVENAGSSLYPRGWPSYLPAYSIDGRQWQRVSESSFVDEQLIFSIPNPAPSLFIAWYEPYPLSHLVTWTENLKKLTNIRLTVPFDKFFHFWFGQAKIGSIVLVARQHPGETMPSFFVEGLMDFLTSTENQAKSLLTNFEFVVFPCMNPEGVLAGRHRYDSRGIDYNRAWERGDAPAEIQFVRETLVKLHKLQFFYDVHGDEVTKKDPSYIDAEPHHGMSRSRLIAQRKILELTCQFTADLEVLKRSSMWRTGLKKFLFPKLYPAERLSEGTTASEYVRKTHGVPAFTYEIKAHGTNSEQCYSMGRALGLAFASYNHLLTSRNST